MIIVDKDKCSGMMGKMVWHAPAFFYLNTCEKLGLLMLPGFVFVKIRVSLGQRQSRQAS